MDGDRFDHVVRHLLGGASRRRVLQRLSALPLAGGLAAFFVDDEASEAKKNKRKKNKKKCKKPAQVCAGKCGSVTYKCKKRKKTADCGPCECDPLCDECLTCNGTTQTCEADPDQVGEPCGEAGQFCQANGDCAAAPCTVCETGCPYSSLQDAIDDPEAGDAITVCAGTYHESLTISRSLIIRGAGRSGNPASATILQGDDTAPVVTIAAGVSVTLRQVRVTGGGDPGINGGGIHNEGTLELISVTVTDNSTPQGGGIFNAASGNLTITDCTITDNTAEFGGGLYLDPGSELEISDSTITDNTATNDGSGIYNLGGTVTMTNTEVSDNDADGDGGGIYNDDGTVNIDAASVVTNNEAGGDGGGLFNDEGTVTCAAQTVTGNTNGNCVNFGAGTGCDTCSPPS